jgi:hypothetical protein
MTNDLISFCGRRNCRCSHFKLAQYNIIILDLQQLSYLVDGEPIHDDLVNYNDFDDIGERFYTPIVETLSICSPH